MKVYLANKMTGIPEFNYPWFDMAAQYLRDVKGLIVMSPAELDSPAARAAALASPDGDLATFEHAAGETWGDILAKDVKLIADEEIDAIVVGPQWHESRGARLETFVAHQLGLPVLRFPDLSRVPQDALITAWTSIPRPVRVAA